MDNAQKIIDTHFHLWDIQELTLTWLEQFEGVLKKKYTLDDYRHSIAHSNKNIVSSCYEEVDVIKSQLEKEARMAIKLCQNPENKVMAATIGCDLSKEKFKDYIALFSKETCIKSVRHNFFAADAELSRTPLFIENTKLLAKLNIMCDLVMPVEKMSAGIELVKACPETTFVINHCGLCPYLAKEQLKKTWQEGISQYALHKNTICKLSESGFMTKDYKWQTKDVVGIIKHCFDSFGEDRVVYASNWPVCEITASIEQWIDAIYLALRGYSNDALNKLFYQNAKNFYG